MLINPFLRWSNSLGNLIQLLPVVILCFEILMLWSMTESVIEPEPFPKDFCVFDSIVL